MQVAYVTNVGSEAAMIFTLAAITATKKSTTAATLRIRGFNHCGVLPAETLLRADRLSRKVSWRIGGS